MSKGVFTILDRMNGVEDAVLTATDVLNARLKRITKEKAMRGEADTRPAPREVFATHFMYCVAEYRPHIAIAHQYLKVANTGNCMLYNGATNRVRFDMSPNDGHFITDQVIHVQFDALTDANYRLQYCDYPGARLIKRAALAVDGVEVDYYTTLTTALNLNTDVDREKFSMMAACLGQQSPKTGYYFNSDLNIIQAMRFCDGAQTPNTTQAALDLWIPLQFWYNLNLGNALHNGLLSTLERSIDIELQDLSNILQATDVNGNPIPSYFANSKLTIRNIELYTRNIYINKEVYDLFSMRRMVSLIRIHRENPLQVNKANSSILLSQFKFPIEHVTFGFLPDSNALTFDSWYRFATLTRVPFPIPAVVASDVAPYQQLAIRTVTYNSYAPVVSQIGMNIYGNELYKLTPERFFNSYMGGVVPDCEGNMDTGVYQIMFSAFRKALFVNGYLNNSDAREIYLNYTSTGISTSSTATFHSVAKCLNFLIYESGRMRLRYAT